MEERELAEVVEQQQFFEAVPSPSPEEDEGTRDMGPLYPFLISGGTNTERYYFTHINDTTGYKFNIFPKYFGNEASYTEIFPERIKDIIKNNAGAKIMNSDYMYFDTGNLNYYQTNGFSAYENAKKCYFDIPSQFKHKYHAQESLNSTIQLLLEVE